MYITSFLPISYKEINRFGINIIFRANFASKPGNSNIILNFPHYIVNSCSVTSLSHFLFILLPHRGLFNSFLKNFKPKTLQIYRFGSLLGDRSTPRYAPQPSPMVLVSVIFDMLHNHAIISDGGESHSRPIGSRIVLNIVIDLMCFTLDSARQLTEALRGKVQYFLHCGSIWVQGYCVQVPTTEDQPRQPSNPKVGFENHCATGSYQFLFTF